MLSKINRETAMKDDPDQRLLDAANARFEAEETENWSRRKAEHSRLQAAARAAHKRRQAKALIASPPGAVVDWDDLCLASKDHLIADAANVSANPRITGPELHRLYQERLLARGDTEHEDLLSAPDGVEELVLTRLKELLATPLEWSKLT